MKILFRDIDAITLSDPVTLSDSCVTVENGVITEVSQTSPEDLSQFDDVIDGHNKLLTPGFVNTHTHLAMVLLRGYADDLPLQRWLEEKIWPLEAKLTGDDVYWGALHGMAEMIRSGTTTFSDMYFFMDRVADGVAETGMRALLGQALFAFEPGDHTDEMFQMTRDFVDKIESLNIPRIKASITPHAPYTVYREAWERVSEIAREHHIPIHTHLSESRTELANAERDWGMSPIEHVHRLGVLEQQVLAAHCVHLSERDIEILAECNVEVLHNPTSNLKLASGFCPVQVLIEQGINVSIGTDGAASNNNLDMLEELRLASLLQKGILGDATAFPALSALRAGTERGARAVGWGDIGNIEIGQRADLLLLDIDRPYWKPSYDPVSNLVYAAQAADIESVMIDGTFVMKNREIVTFDEEKASAVVREFQDRYRRK